MMKLSIPLCGDQLIRLHEAVKKTNKQPGTLFEEALDVYLDKLGIPDPIPDVSDTVSAGSAAVDGPVFGYSADRLYLERLAAARRFLGVSD